MDRCIDHRPELTAINNTLLLILAEFIKSNAEFATHNETHYNMYDRMNDKMKGIYMTQSCNYQCHKNEYLAAFDAAVERANMVDLIKDKIENPIEWES